MLYVPQSLISDARLTEAQERLLVESIYLNML